MDDDAIVVALARDLFTEFREFSDRLPTPFGPLPRVGALLPGSLRVLGPVTAENFESALPLQWWRYLDRVRDAFAVLSPDAQDAIRRESEARLVS